MCRTVWGATRASGIVIAGRPSHRDEFGRYGGGRAAGVEQVPERVLRARRVGSLLRSLGTRRVRPAPGIDRARAAPATRQIRLTPGIRRVRLTPGGSRVWLTPGGSRVRLTPW
ncbi:MAG TPA: hypothetical protein VGA04_18270, partial [Streptosporangiaceae bacterium]